MRTAATLIYPRNNNHSKNRLKMKTRQRITVPILADREVFDYLKEKVGERKTKTEAYCDLLDKTLAGFVSPFLRNQEFELHPNQCHVTVSRPFSGMALAQGYRPFFPRCTGGVRPAEPYPSFQKRHHYHERTERQFRGVLFRTAGAGVCRPNA